MPSDDDKPGPSAGATLDYWNKLWGVAGEQQTNLGPAPTRKQFADSYGEGALKIMALPTRRVDPELTRLACKYANDLMAFHDVLNRPARRHELGYGLGKVVDGAFGGLVAGMTGDVRGAFDSLTREWSGWKRDVTEYEAIQLRLKGNFGELNNLRVQLTAKYGVEFALRME